jgi:hypothetical protein
MESSTNFESFKDALSNPNAWTRLEESLGLDLEASARQQKALVRRRGIRSASDLLRVVLVYCAQDWSLRQLGMWALLQEVGYLSDVALLKRLRNCTAWLGQVLYRCLQQRQVDLADQPGIRVRLQDATVITAPGSRGTQWRMHLKLDLGQRCIHGVEVTDAHGGETLARLPIEAGEIVVADRGYAFASGIGAVLDQLAHVVVRINWQNLPLWTPSGTRFALIDWLNTLTTHAEQAVALETPHGRFALRVIACPLAPEAVEEARRRARKAAQKKHHTISEATLLAAGFLLVVTDLPQAQWPIERVLWLYRLRWQVELQFKAYKSLLQFDHLRAKDPRLVRTYLFGKLLLVLLLEQLTQQVRLHQPEWFADLDRPVSLWGLTACLKEQLRQLLTGRVPLPHFWTCLPALERYVRLSPRDRPQQLAWGQALLEHLSGQLSFFDC